MDMFCFQCEQTAKNEGCKIKGVCGKNADSGEPPVFCFSVTLFTLADHRVQN